MKLYVATSWRNARQPLIVVTLRAAGHEVYDFRNPKEGDLGFHWSQIDPDWQSWSPEQFKSALHHPLAREGFLSDMDAIKEADGGVLVMPCGRSAHLEAGCIVGSGKPLWILLSDGEPELMYKMAYVYADMDKMVDHIGVIAAQNGRKE